MRVEALLPYPALRSSRHRLRWISCPRRITSKKETALRALNTCPTQSLGAKILQNPFEQNDGFHSCSGYRVFRAPANWVLSITSQFVAGRSCVNYNIMIERGLQGPSVRAQGAVCSLNGGMTAGSCPCVERARHPSGRQIFTKMMMYPSHQMQTFWVRCL